MKKFKIFEITYMPEFSLKHSMQHLISAKVCAENTDEAWRLSPPEKGYRVVEIAEINRHKFNRDTVMRITKNESLLLHSSLKQGSEFRNAGFKA